ncbi:MAG: hypothetical protein AAF916_12915, partial [Planctomycetota bacterium]
QVSTLREGVSAKEASLAAANRQLESDLNTANGEVTALEAQLAKAQADSDAIRAAIVASQETTNTNTALLDATLDQLRDAQSALVDRSTQNTQLVARNNQLEADRSALENQVRSLREQTVALTEELQGLEQAVVAAGGTVPQVGVVAAAAPAPTEALYGAITGQDVIPGGKAYVQLNVGSSDGVVKNQRFVAFRGDNELVANLEILAVNASDSVAIVLGQPRQTIQTGDSVVSAPNL